MENERKKERLKEALSKKEFIKLMFIYPDTKPIFNRGFVIAVSDDGFDFNDRYNGIMVFGYNYLESIEEIKEESENGKNLE